MKRRDWWLGVGAIVMALLLHAAFPRYDWRTVAGFGVLRIDRWTGRMERGAFYDARGWVSVARRQSEAGAAAESVKRPTYLDDNGNELPLGRTR